MALSFTMSIQARQVPRFVVQAFIDTVRSHVRMPGLCELIIHPGEIGGALSEEQVREITSAAGPLRELVRVET